MEEREAQEIAERWSGGAGLVPRGPTVVLGVKPAIPGDVERHTGRRPSTGSRLWRVEVGGRFLCSGGLVYPGGVPFPEELHRQTAVIANEVWLYVDATGVVGAYWWPDAMRRPIASVPRDEFSPEQVVHPSDAAPRLEFPLRVPSCPPWEALVAVCLGRREAIVFLTRGTTPDPLHEMLVYEQGGLSLRERMEAARPDLDGFLRDHQPPYRRISVAGHPGVGREPGRALGPQTWPWPGEVRWWNEGISYELKGFVPLAELTDVATAVCS